MVSLEKLSTYNIDKFRMLNVENLKMNTYDKNFFEYYDNEKFLLKFIYKKFVKLFIYNGEIIGFIWYEMPIDLTIRIWAIYVKDDYIHLLNQNTLRIFNSSVLIYDAIDNKKTNKLLLQLGFSKSKLSTLMCLNIDNYNKENLIFLLKYNLEGNINLINRFNKHFNCNINNINITISTMNVNLDQFIRCNLQNEIFQEKGRLPMEIDDIENDINQDYYINDLSLFIKLNNIAVGYGQIIYNRSKYTVVNFGVIKEFRSFGLGKILLHNLITKFKEKYKENLYLRVEDSNINAYKLYSWIGFKPEVIINSWERK